MKLNDEFTNLVNSNSKKKRKFITYEKLGIVSPQNIVKGFSIDLDQKTKNILFTLVLVLGCILFLSTKAFTLQVVEGKANKDKSDQNTYRKELIQPYRGAIVDANGNILARNDPSFAVELDLARCRNGFKDLKKDCLEDLANLKDILPENTTISELSDIKNHIERGVLSMIVVKDLTKEQSLDIQTQLNSHYLSQTLLPQRDYLYPEAFAHVLGFTGIGDTAHPTVEGKDGIEKHYDTYLRGIAGEKVYRVNSFGEIQETVSEKAPIPGSDLQLSLDKDLQLLAYNLLKEKVDGKKVFGGAVVAQNPQNGEVIALVSYPSYDSKKLSRGLSSKEFSQLTNEENQPFFNRAIGGAYPPGSTFKMITATAGLMENTITEETTITDPGYIKVGSFIFRNWKLDGHGIVDIYTALQKSNDTYFYTVGGGYGPVKGLGIKRLHDWAQKFGYGEKTGIDLYGESRGYMPDGTARDWYLGDDFISAIGQGDILATPLQVNTATTFFANGGKIFKPRLIKDDNVAKPVNEGFSTEENYDIVRKGLLMASETGGTAYPFFDFESKYAFKAAGKTGTSEFINKYGEPDTHGWFTVFAPYDSSNITLTVFVEGGSTGSDDAAVIARKLMDKWFENNSSINR